MKDYNFTYFSLLKPLFLLFFLTIAVPCSWGQNSNEVFNIKGNVVDEEDNKPVSDVIIRLANTSITTVTNSEGNFTIKIPEKNKNDNLSLSLIGYYQTIKPISSLNGNSIIKIKKSPVQVDEIAIRDLNPIELLQLALKKIPDNYSTLPEMQTAFYRETIKKNNVYTSIAETVIDVYKPEYPSQSQDLVKLLKARKEICTSCIDTLVMKLQGGPKLAYSLDIVHYPNLLLGEDIAKLYYVYVDKYSIFEGNLAYIIHFKPKEMTGRLSYEGDIYIDVNKLAIIGVDFWINEEQWEVNSKYFIVKKPSGYKIKLGGVHYKTRYAFHNDTWYFNNVSAELIFKIRKERQWFNRTYTTAFNMAITDHSQENVSKPKIKYTYKTRDILIDNVKDFEDPDFWGDYNIIEPESSINTAINKLNKKLKRQYFKEQKHKQIAR